LAEDIFRGTIVAKQGLAEDKRDDQHPEEAGDAGSEKAPDATDYSQEQEMAVDEAPPLPKPLFLG
jgi:hypothetical protein